nr:hypothetical protein B0A51_13650 [Rachicladosporium sp. CCFEE 5018]
MSSYHPRRHRSTSHDRTSHRGTPKEPRRDSYMRSYSPGGTEYPSFPPPPRSETQREASPTGTAASRGASQYALAPYDEEKAYAEYTRVYGPEEPYPPPPPRSEASTQYAPRRLRSPSPLSDDLTAYSGPRRRQYVDYDDDRTVSTRYSPPPSSYASRRTRRRSLHSPSPPKETENAITSSLIGGASGAYLGNRLIGRGALGTLGGAVVGALGVKAIDLLDEKRKGKHAESPRRRRTDDLRGSEYGYESSERGTSRYSERPRYGRRRSYSVDTHR